MESTNDFVSGVLQMSPPVALAAALWCLGQWIKRVPSIQNWIIPFICPAIGGIVYPLIAQVGEMNHNVRWPIGVNIIQGFLIGAGPIMIDQMRRQWLEFRSEKRKDDDTSFIRRDSDTPKPVESNEAKADPPNIGTTPGLP